MQTKLEYSLETPLVEEIAGFVIQGTKNIENSTLVWVIKGLGTPHPSVEGLRKLAFALEREAKELKVKQLKIIGKHVGLEGLLNPKLYKRFGYQFRQIDNTSFEIIKNINADSIKK